MKRLLTLDKKDYTEDMPVNVRYSTRAIIVKNGRIATQRGNQGDYKLLGGGMEAHETPQETICREVREEAGLFVIPGSIREIGEVVERRRDRFVPEEVYECHSLVFACEVSDETTEPKMTESEISRGYCLNWATPEEIIAGNTPLCDSQLWSYRDMQTVRLLLENGELSL